MNKFSQIYSTLFFIGYIKWAPGTIASIVSLVLIFLLENYLINNFIFVFIFFILFFLSLISIHIYSKNIKNHDSKEIVIDEFLGIYTILIFINNFNFLNNINTYFKLLIILIFFRFFDILKPYPISWIDRNIKNSFGVLFDDIIAGVYTIIAISILNVFI